MVAWIVNDLSLDRQYLASKDFLDEFERVFVAGLALKKAGHSLSCSRGLGGRFISDDATCASVIFDNFSREMRNLALRWLTKGPFWTAPPGGEAIVFYQKVDVTDQGLGEAARRIGLNDKVRTFSFEGLSLFEQPTLKVECLREGAAAQEIVEVPNDWDVLSFKQVVAEPEKRGGWAGMLEEAKKFSGLNIAHEQIIKEMTQYPYDSGARNRLLEILKHLNSLALAREKYSDNSSQVTEWLHTYVQTSRAVFSSENAPKEIFTFYDPFSNGERYCPWHGKVHNPLQYRVHYEWPIPLGQKRLKVLFIGEKLTKQ